MCVFFFFQAEDGIRDLVRSRGLGDVYKRQDTHRAAFIVYSDGSVFYCANDKCTSIDGAPRNSLSLIHI